MAAQMTVTMLPFLALSLPNSPASQNSLVANSSVQQATNAINLQAVSKPQCVAVPKGLSRICEDVKWAVSPIHAGAAASIDARVARLWTHMGSSSIIADNLADEAGGGRFTIQNPPQRCKFPFTYKGQTYNECARTDLANETEWCMTDDNGAWGACGCKKHRWTVSGKACLCPHEVVRPDCSIWKECHDTTQVISTGGCQAVDNERGTMVERCLVSWDGTWEDCAPSEDGNDPVKLQKDECVTAKTRFMCAAMLRSCDEGNNRLPLCAREVQELDKKCAQPGLASSYMKEVGLDVTDVVMGSPLRGGTRICTGFDETTPWKKKTDQLRAPPARLDCEVPTGLKFCSGSSAVQYPVSMEQRLWGVVDSRLETAFTDPTMQIFGESAVCQDAVKVLMCRGGFNRCENDRTVPICKGVCKNLHSVCSPAVLTALNTSLPLCMSAPQCNCTGANTTGLSSSDVCHSEMALPAGGPSEEMRSAGDVRYTGVLPLSSWLHTKPPRDPTKWDHLKEMLRSWVFYICLMLTISTVVGVMVWQKLKSTEMMFAPPDLFDSATPPKSYDIEKVFNMFDADGGGTIDIEELGLMLRELGLEFSKAEVKKIMIESDEDGSGNLDLDEFVALVMHLWEERHPGSTPKQTPKTTPFATPKATPKGTPKQSRSSFGGVN